MKKTAAVFFSFFFFLSVLRAHDPHPQPDFAALDAYCEKARAEWNSPGLAVGIIWNDSIKLAKGYGTLSVGSSEKVNADTRFGIASNTKAFTAAALAILVDEKKVAWDDKVVKYLPYFKMYNPYVTSEMTLRDLLTHRSGLKTFSGDLIWYNSTYNRRQVIERLQYLKPSYGFRERYGYSNILYLVAGEVVEAVTGKSWDEFMVARFFTPLGMKRSNTGIAFQKDDPNVALPHTEVEGEMQTIPYVDWTNIAPAGSINSTVNDMLRWIKLQLQRGQWKGNQIFSESRSREMWQPQTIDNVSAFSERIHPSKHFSTYGLGWSLFDYNGYKIVTHSGGLDGMVSQTFLIPELNAGAVILSNSATSLPYALMWQLIESFTGSEAEAKDWSGVYRNFYDTYRQYEKERQKKKAVEATASTPASLDLKKYAGVYSGKVYGEARVELTEAGLYLRLTANPVFHSLLTHSDGDVFTLRFEEQPSLPEGTVTFILDKHKKKVVQLVIDIPNPDFDFTELDLFKVK